MITITRYAFSPFRKKKKQIDFCSGNYTPCGRMSFRSYAAVLCTRRTDYDGRVFLYRTRQHYDLIYGIQIFRPKTVVIKHVYGPNKCGYSENAYVNIHDTRIHLYIYFQENTIKDTPKTNVVVDGRPKYVCETTDRRGRRLLKRPNSTLPSATDVLNK